MTTHTRLIPPPILDQLKAAQRELQSCYDRGNPERAAKILTDIDNLLDQTGGHDEWP